MLDNLCFAFDVICVLLVCGLIWLLYCVDCCLFGGCFMVCLFCSNFGLIVLFVLIVCVGVGLVVYLGWCSLYSVVCFLVGVVS